MKNINKKNKGFTLIEILVVIGIIAILAAIVIIAINPAKQFAQARNTQRTSNTNAILNAVGQRMADNKGVFKGEYVIDGNTYICPTLDEDNAPILNDDEDDADDESGLLRDCLVPTYMSALPYDPTADPEEDDTGYTIELLSNGRIEVCAPNMVNEPALPTVVLADTCVTR